MQSTKNTQQDIFDKEDASSQKTQREKQKANVADLVSPTVFSVADVLLNQSLARPWRRLIALLIDAVLISLLSLSHWFFICLLCGHLLWRRLKARQYKQSVAFACLVFLMSTSFSTAQLTPSQDSGVEIPMTAVSDYAFSVYALSKESCTFGCVDTELAKFSAKLNQTDLLKEDKKELIESLIKLSTLSQGEVAQIQTRVESLLTETEVATQESSAQYSSSLLREVVNSNYSFLKWAQAALKDFGLGFGWAVVYFTFYLSWNQGQTPGKWLLGIQVVHLNQVQLSLWNAFSRQGGYLAGISTGLIGFLQVFWDPNRQAIHDKVASTVVILKRKKTQPDSPLP